MQLILAHLVATWPAWAQWLITGIMLVSVAGFATSEYLANNPEVKPNSVWEWARAIFAANSAETPIIERIVTGDETPAEAVEDIAPIVNEALQAVQAKLGALKGA
jgi:hypothetical protein